MNKFLANHEEMIFSSKLKGRLGWTFSSTWYLKNYEDLTWGGKDEPEVWRSHNPRLIGALRPWWSRVCHVCWTGGLKLHPSFMGSNLSYQLPPNVSSVGLLPFVQLPSGSSELEYLLNLTLIFHPNILYWLLLGWIFRKPVLSFLSSIYKMMVARLFTFFSIFMNL